MIELRRIAEICADYTGEDYFVDERIPRNKLANARAAFPIPARERVVAFVDATVFGSGKNGLAICESGIYWHNDWTTTSHVRYLTWEEFAEVEIRRQRRGDIELGWGNLFDMSGSSFRKDVLVSLLEELRDYAADALDGNLDCDADEYEEDDGCASCGDDEEEEWMVAIDGESYGPFDLEMMRDMVREGRIPPRASHVWKAGMAEWVPFMDRPETAALLGPPSAQPAPPTPPAASATRRSARTVDPAPANDSAPRSVREIDESVDRALAESSAARNRPEAESPDPVDVNAAPRERLLELPGIGLAEADRIVRARATNGGFRSAEQVGRELGLKPHQVVRLRERATFGGGDGPGTAPGSSGGARPGTNAPANASPGSVGGSSPAPSSSPARRNPGRIVDY